MGNIVPGYRRNKRDYERNGAMAGSEQGDSKSAQNKLVQFHMQVAQTGPRESNMRIVDLTEDELDYFNERAGILEEANLNMSRADAEIFAMHSVEARRERMRFEKELAVEAELKEGK